MVNKNVSNLLKYVEYMCVSLRYTVTDIIN